MRRLNDLENPTPQRKGAIKRAIRRLTPCLIPGGVRGLRAATGYDGLE